MKVLSIQEPYASLIACGAKRIETRSWSTPYRGPLAIHASKQVLDEDYDLFEEDLQAHGVHHMHPGCIIAVCDVVDVTLITRATVPPEPERSYGNYQPGRFAWHLAGAVWVTTPIPVRGQLGLWEYPGKIAR